MPPHNKRMQKPRFKNLPKEQKLLLIMMVVACGLVFYAIGITTNFFGLPIFSIFFIISYNTAHDIVTYLALVIAIALSVITVTVTLIKKRKISPPQTPNKPFTRMMKARDQASGRARMPTETLKMVSNLENSRVTQKNQQATHPVIQPTNRSPDQTANQQYVVKDSTINRQVDKKEEKGTFTCPNCKKEFSTPLFTLEYAASTPMLIRRCPYCDQPLDRQQKNVPEEDLRKKY